MDIPAHVLLAANKAAILNLGKSQQASVEAIAAAVLEAAYGDEEQPRYTTRRLRDEVERAYQRGKAEAAEGLTAAIRDVRAERRRQVEEEGWTAEHDDAEHSNGELAAAAACYANPMAVVIDGLGVEIIPPNSDTPPLGWPDPWDHEWYKPKGRRRDLVRSAALIIAEIELIDRASALEKQED